MSSLITYQDYLNTIYRGHHELWELQDYFNLPTRMVWRSVQRLLEEGYLKPESSQGPGKLIFYLGETEGVNLVSVPGEERELIEQCHLSLPMRDVLTAVLRLSKRKNHVVSFDIIDEIGLWPGSRLNPLVYRLEQNGYLETGGWFRRHHRITEKGCATLDAIG